MFEVSRLNKLLILVRDIDDMNEALASSSDVTMVFPVYEGLGAKYYGKVAEKALKHPLYTENTDIVYDCSNSFRDALEAIRMGAKVIKVTDDYKSYFKVIDIANKYKTKVITTLPGKAKSIRKKGKK